MKILVVEDSERLRRSLRIGLQRSGFAVEAVADGREALDYARHGTYDAIVLDLMLPGMDGLTLLRTLREEGHRVHVLILSAKDQVAERVEGLRLGADDYLTKPFAFEELVARLRALVRRQYGTKSPVQEVGGLTVDTAARSVRVDGDELAVTRSEYMVLEYLLAHRGGVVSKAELLDHLHAGADGATENAVEVIVHQLRRKLRGHGIEDLIR
ncbi:MAG: response regulator transcription factor, partial [Planctomycetota bacterium]